jgi:hypothetical protein
MGEGEGVGDGDGDADALGDGDADGVGAGVGVAAGEGLGDAASEAPGVAATTGDGPAVDGATDGAGLHAASPRIRTMANWPNRQPLIAEPSRRVMALPSANPASAGCRGL